MTQSKIILSNEKLLDRLINHSLNYLKFVDLWIEEVIVAYAPVIKFIFKYVFMLFLRIEDLTSISYEIYDGIESFEIAVDEYSTHFISL